MSGYPEEYVEKVFAGENAEMSVFSAGILALVNAIDRLSDKVELVQNELYLLRMKS